MKKQLILLLVATVVTGNIDAAAQRFYNWFANNRSRIALTGAALSSGAAAYYLKNRNQSSYQQLTSSPSSRGFRSRGFNSRDLIMTEHDHKPHELGVLGIIPIESKASSETFKPYWDSRNQKWVDPSDPRNCKYCK